MILIIQIQRSHPRGGSFSFCLKQDTEVSADRRRSNYNDNEKEKYGISVRFRVSAQSYICRDEKGMNEFEKVYRTYFTDVYRYLLKLTGDETVSEEITAECFFRAMNALNTLKSDASVRVWLCSIARNIWYDRLRQQKRFDELSDTGMMRIVSPGETPEEHLLNEARNEEVGTALAGLKEPYGKILKMRFYEDMSYQEIGSAFNKTANWACVMCHRAKQMLKKELKEYEE